MEVVKSRGDALFFDVWPRCQRARQALRRAGVRGEKLAGPPIGQTWTSESAAEFAAALLNEIDDLMRAFIQTDATGR